MTTIKSILEASPEKYICGAMDEGGNIYLYEFIPLIDKTGGEFLLYDDRSAMTDITSLVERKPENWETSLVYRDEYESKQEFPFKSGDKVFVRASKRGDWYFDFFSHLYKKDDIYTFACVSGIFKQITSFEGNESLAGTTKDSNTKVWTQEDL